MIENPFAQLPSPESGEAIHILITKPGAIVGTETERKEIVGSLPKPPEGKHWEYQPLAAYPLRFATLTDADNFMHLLAEKQASDKFFVAPMVYEKQQNKWRTNKAYNTAEAELVVFVTKGDEVVVPAPAPEAAP